MGWYIDQKMEYDQLREVRTLKPTQAERGNPPKERLVKKEIIVEAVKVKSQQDANYYPQPLQTPCITNAMKSQLQPPYYHSTPAHNYGQSSDKAPKRDDQYFVDMSQPQQTSYNVSQPSAEPDVLSAPHNLSSMSTIRAHTNSSSMEGMNYSIAQNSQKCNTAHAELQNAMLQLAKIQSEMLNSLAQNQMQLQENNMVMMTDLLSSHHNLCV